MAEKKLHGRIVHKHDTASNWAKATSFVPMKGELIIYDIDDTHDYERFKIGDGKTTVNALPFAGSTNDYTITEKNKLADIENGANKTIVDSALSSSSTNPVQNKVIYDTFDSLVGDDPVSDQITKAIADKVDSKDAITGLSASGQTVTYTKGDGTTGTITTQDTHITYSAGTGIALDGTTFSNSGVRSVATGSANGTISVNTNGISANVAVKGLGSAAYTAYTAYDAAGAANSALTDAKEYADELYEGITPESIGALPITGGNITGYFRLKNHAKYPEFSFWPSSLASVASKMIANVAMSDEVITSNHLSFRELSYESGTNNMLQTYENYNLPRVDADKTTNNNYDILTTKNPVTVAQGGTGATTAETALTNLGAVSQDAFDAHSHSYIATTSESGSSSFVDYRTLSFKAGTVPYGDTVDGSYNSPYGAYTSGGNQVDYGSLLRANFSNAYYTDLWFDANRKTLTYRQVINGVSQGWKQLVDTSGATMTGTLIAGGGFTVKQESTWPAIDFQCGSGNDGSFGLATGTSTLNRNYFYFREKSQNSSDYSSLSYYEDYRLPYPDKDRTSNGTYYILTTKDVVTVAQGGTGATTKADARTNLGIKSGTSLPESGTVGDIFFLHN